MGVFGQESSELAKYPRPSVAVDVALLTVVEGARSDQLHVLVHRRGEGAGEGQWALPGRFLRPEDENLEQTARVALREKVGVEGRRPRQLRVFDKPGRDDRGWVLSVAHVDLALSKQLPARLESGCLLAPLLGEPVLAQLAGNERLFLDHDEIVRAAVEKVRRDYELMPDPYRLLGGEFTLYQLHRLHQAVLGPHAPKKDAFRRQMKRHVAPSEKPAPRAVGKPAQLYGHAVGSETHGPR